jgi:hypothetical protein
LLPFRQMRIIREEGPIALFRGAGFGPDGVSMRCRFTKQTHFAFFLQRCPLAREDTS